MPNWSDVRDELTRGGVTLFLLWEKYNRTYPDGYCYSQFCALFSRWRQIQSPAMIQRHPPGEKLFVDYAGQTMPIVNPATGEVHHAQIFVTALGASSYTFAEATPTQSTADWLGSHVRCFEFYGGVPRIVVPDNLKAGVTSPCRYEPAVNVNYQRLAVHYGIAVVPARVRKPKDKSKVENAVQQVEHRILAELRNHTFHSVAELNAAIKPLLAALNNRESKHLGASRRQLFDTVERSALRPLPDAPYEECLWQWTRVGIDYHVRVEGHRYSVPHSLLKLRVQVRVSARTVEVFHGDVRVASHMRSAEVNGVTTATDHMPAAHLLMRREDETFLEAGGKHGCFTRRFIEAVLGGQSVREQASRTCMGVLKLGESYGSARLEAACRRAFTGQKLSYRVLQHILQHGYDQLPQEKEEPQATIIHDNLRGGNYFARTATGADVRHQSDAAEVPHA